MTRRVLAGLAVIGAALAGCSQVSALAPVSGVPITTLRTASYDVLLREGVDILVAPQCVEEQDRFSCTGSTLDGQSITVVAPTEEPLTMTVTVGDTVLFTGEVQSVLDDAAEVQP